MTTMQFPPTENQAVKKNVIDDLSLLDNSQKLSLPEDYEIISDPPYRKNKPLSLPVCTTNIEYLNYQDKLFKTVFDKKNHLAEIIRFKKCTMVFIPFEQFDM